MDTLFKVCDAMENVSLTAATVAPKCFTCGSDTTISASTEEIAYGSGCGDLSSKFASHDRSYIMDENSMCTYDDDTVSDIKIESRRNKEQFKPTERNSSHQSWRRQSHDRILVSDDDDAFTGRKSSWPSIDGNLLRRRSSSKTYSKSLFEHQATARRGFHDETTDDDRAYRTYETHDNVAKTYDTYDDESKNSRGGKQNDAEADGGAFDKLRMDLRLDKIGMDLFGFPSDWTNVVKKKSSWSSSSYRTPSSTTPESTSIESTSSGSDGSVDRSRNRRDDYNSLEPKDFMHNSTEADPPDILKNPAGLYKSSSNTNSMTRELPSFGKSREFRSFGSNRSNPSLDSMASFYSLKPTYMTPHESKQLDEESSGYRYIIPNPPLDQASTRIISTMPLENDSINFDYEDQELSTTNVGY